MSEVSKEQIESEIELKFWLVFIGYIVCSVAWIAYCVISHRRDVESLKQMEEYWTNRQAEQERLLRKYESVQVDAAIRRSLLVEPSAPSTSVINEADFLTNQPFPLYYSINRISFTKMLKLLILLALLGLVNGFDKRQLMKEKYTAEKHRGELIPSPPDNDASLGNEKSKHPISRRVLRWERSAEPLFEPESDFPMPDELQVLPSDLDFVKVRPHLPPKVKPSLMNNEVEYDPAIEF